MTRSAAGHRHLVAAAPALAAAMFPALPLLAAPRVYEIHPMGLTDAAHTGANGIRVTDLYYFNPAGQAVGTSERWVEFGRYGRSAWFYDPVARQTVPIGLRGTGYIGLDDMWDVHPLLLGPSGQVVGTSSAWNGTVWKGWHPWLYDHATQTTTRIGLTDAQHTASNGEQRSHPLAMNHAGAIIGHAYRYDGVKEAGYTAWIRNPTTGVHAPIGFTDAAHTRADGYRDSHPGWIDPAGFVVGFSSRFNGTSAAGLSAWLHQPAGGSTTRLGFTGYPYVGPNGAETTQIDGIRNSRFVIGNSSTYDGSSEYYDPWIYDIQNASYKRYGLTDADHTTPAGYRSGDVAGMNDRGDVAGLSWRFSPGTVVSNTAWYYEASTGQYQTIGLTDAEHTTPAGRHSNTSRFISAAGHVAGTAQRAKQKTWPTGGTSAWLFDPATDTTTKLGLYDGVHSHQFGYQESGVIDMNDAGQVLGFSERYNATPTRSAWFYDPVTKTQTPLIFSVLPNGLANTNAAYLGEDGVVLGTYVKGDGDDSFSVFNYHGFFWSPGDGFHDLGTFVEGGLSPDQWHHVAGALGRAGPHIFGTAYQDSQGQSLLAYVLSPKPGDTNYDGQVNFTDLVALAQNYNTSDRSYEQGDLNSDGVVDFGDLVILAQNYGPPAAGGPHLSQLGPAFQEAFARAQSQVPEPTSALVLVASTILLGARRRR